VAYSSFYQIIRDIKHGKNKTNRGHGQFTGMLLLDVEKAFDSVWHDALLQKLSCNICNNE
jgi:hypothetical protein